MTFRHVLFSLLILAGCSYQKPARGPESVALFEVLPVTVVRTEVVSADPTWGMPLEKAFFLRACMRDRATQFPRVGETVVVRGGPVPQTRITDADGCLYWNENISYRPLAREVGVQITRTLDSHGVTSPLLFVLNPWRSELESLADQKMGLLLPSIPEAQAKDALAGVGAHDIAKAWGDQLTNLRLAGISVPMRHRVPVGGEERVVFSPILSFEAVRLRRERDIVPEVLNQGKFRVVLHLIERSQSPTERAVVATGKESITSLVGGSLTVSAELAVPTRYLMRGKDHDLALGYEIYPIAAEATGLLPHIGRYPLGSFLDDVAPSGGVGVIDAAPVRRTVVEAENAPDAVGFLVHRPKIQFHDASVKDGSRWLTEIPIELELCFTRTFGAKPLEGGVPFRVQFADEANPANATDPKAWSHLKTGHDGCVKWVEKVQFSFTGKIRFLKKYIRVESEAKEFEGAKGARVQIVYIDPWQHNAITDWDESKGAPVPGDVGDAMVKLTSISYGKLLDRELYVDPYLGLQFRYHYEWTLVPELNRPGAIGYLLAPRPVFAKTKFQVRAALLAPTESSKSEPENLAKYRFVSGFDTTVVAQDNGQLKLEVILPVELADQPLLDLRTRVLVELVPLSPKNPAGDALIAVASGVGKVAVEGELPKGAAVTAFFDARSEKDGSSANASHHHVSEFHLMTKGFLKTEELKKFGDLKIHSPKLQLEGKPHELLLKAKRIQGVTKHVDLKAGFPAELAGMRVEDVPMVLDRPERDLEFAKRFDFVYSANANTTVYGAPAPTDRESFQKAPMEFTKITRFSYVDEVNPTPLSSKGDVESINVSAAVFKERIEENRDAKGSHAGVLEEKGNERYLGFDGLGTGRHWFWTSHNSLERFTSSETANVDEFAKSTHYSRLANLYVDRLRVSLRVKQKQCLLMEFRPGRQGPVASYLFCRPGPETLEEVWRYVSDEFRVGAFSFLDSRRIQERQLVKVIRGEEAYAAFDKAMMEKTRTLAIHFDGVNEGRSSGEHSGFIPQLTEAVAHQEAFPGIVSVRSRGNPAVAFELRCREIANQIVTASGEKKLPSSEQLAAYFSLVRRLPQKFLTKEASQKDFADFGKLLVARGAAARAAYLEMLDLLHTWVREDFHPKEREWLKAFAAGL